MFQNFRTPVLFASAVCILFASCKKDDKKDPILNDHSAEIAAHADDQNRISNELNAVVDDANFALESEAGFSGRMMDPQNPNFICGATYIVDTISNPRTVTITYNGLNCQNNHYRTGTVTVSMAQGVRWKNQGAQVGISFSNFKIKRVSDNKSITINGTQTFTNVTGGLLWQLQTINPIIHTIQSNNMSVLFDDSTTRNWNIARKRTFTYNSGAELKITGTHTIGNNTGVAEWGTNRFGHPFTTSITQPLTIQQNCNYRLVSGEIKHQGFATSVVLFGLDSNGNPMTQCPGTNPFYYKITWTGPNGNSLSAIYPY